MAIDNINELLKYTTSTKSTIDFSNPTYDGLKNQLQALITSNNNLIDISTASTIGILIDNISMIGDFNNYTVESAIQENFYSTAKLASSVYLKAMDQGVHIQRNIPCHTTASLYRDNTSMRVLIPAFTQFKADNYSLFNREPILFNAGVSQLDNIVLYEGEVKYQTYISNGESFQKYNIGDTPYAISDQDIYCWVNGRQWQRDLNGLFTYNMFDEKFFENTTPAGYSLVTFGDNIYGKAPALGETIQFLYVNTQGSEAQAATADIQVKVPEYSSIKGTITNSLIGGDMRKSAYFYQQMGASLSATNSRTVTRDDFPAIISTYEGVRDVKVRGQAEIAPQRKEWMNVLALTLLTDTLWTNADFDNLVNWLKKNYSIQNMQFVRVDPVGYYVDIDVTLYCQPSANLQNVYLEVENSIKNLFTPKIGTIGKSIYRSDIENAILTAGNINIDAYTLNTPAVDFIVKDTEYLRLGDLTINTEYTQRSSDSLI